MSKFYIVKPYRVGSTGKSLAMVIPAQLVREYEIDVSTMLALRTDEKREKITVRSITGLLSNLDSMIPAGESLEASSQQVPSSGVQ